MTIDEPYSLAPEEVRDKLPQIGRCGLWRYPQQLSALVDSTEVTGLRKRQPFRRTLETPVCNDCAEKQR